MLVHSLFDQLPQVLLAQLRGESDLAQSNPRVDGVVKPIPESHNRRHLVLHRPGAVRHHMLLVLLSTLVHSRLQCRDGFYLPFQCSLKVVVVLHLYYICVLLVRQRNVVQPREQHCPELLVGGISSLTGSVYSLLHPVHKGRELRERRQDSATLGDHLVAFDPFFLLTYEMRVPLLHHHLQLAGNGHHNGRRLCSLHFPCQNSACQVQQV
mmetsp:Transcript_34796/g.68363  ORF Transcript_34796/g.68363 Transcript_34796/m.68363 type:complete len:210 (+) Transcript_34796:486-1115(+)